VYALAPDRTSGFTARSCWFRPAPLTARSPV